MAKAKPDLSTVLSPEAIRFAEDANLQVVGGQPRAANENTEEAQDPPDIQEVAPPLSLRHGEEEFRELPYGVRPRDIKAQFSVKLPADLILRLRHLATTLEMRVGSRVAIQDIVEAALRKYIDEASPRTRKP